MAAAPSAPFAADSGTLLGVKGVVAAVAVGFRSPLSAFGAGLGLGVVEAAIANASIEGHVLGPRYSTLIPVLLALIVLEAIRRRGEEPVE